MIFLNFKRKPDSEKKEIMNLTSKIMNESV